MKNPKSQASSSSYYSTSQLSEPPDIKQWFLSYTYQSPELDTYEEFCLSHEVDDEERELCVYNETEDEGECEDITKIDSSVPVRNPTEEARKHEFSALPAVEAPACPDLLSLPSEPPDITNWFSSYVYESPELDSADFDVTLSSGYTFGYKEEVNKGRGDHVENLLVPTVRDEILSLREAITRPCGVENRNSSTSHEDGSARRNLSPKNSLCLKRNSDQRASGVKQNNPHTIPNNFVEFTDEDLSPIRSVEKELTSVSHLGSPAKASYNRGRGFTETGEEKTEKKLIAAENDSGWISLNRKPREEFPRSISKEREEYISAENQYNSMMNIARPSINKENSPFKSCSSDGRKVKRLRREILQETTNLDHSQVPEVAGKWKCPQKCKPNTGPPLKQLRLERWVHKI